MKKERYYYAIASFMNKDGNRAVASVDVHSTGDDPKFYPLMETIKRMEEAYADTAIFGTILVSSVMEISKEDYDAFRERQKRLNGEEKED